jgi:hypothetical protein
MLEYRMFLADSKNYEAQSINALTPPCDLSGPLFYLLKCLASVSPAVVLLALLLPWLITGGRCIVWRG